jgi:hypothetical protein
MSTAEWCPEPGPAPQKDACKTQSTINTSYLCENGWQPLLITGFLRDLLARQWSDPGNIVSPEMKQYLWSEGQTSGILIESVYRYRADLVEKRPAIMIKRNSFKNMQTGFAGQMQGIGSAAYENEKGAISCHTTLFIGSHTLFCIHGTGASTEILASEVMSHLVACLWPIRRHLGLRQFSVTEVGAIQEIEESNENYVIPITVGWGYEHTWQLREESLPLQSVSLTSLLGGASEAVAMGTSYQGP